MRISLGLTVLLLLSIPSFVRAAPTAAAANNSTPVVAALQSETTSIVAGGSIRLGLVLQHAPGWHTYWTYPGDSGKATRLSWQLPDGMSAGTPQWPVPEVHRFGAQWNYGYAGTTLIPVSIDAPHAKLGQTLDLALHVRWLACKTQCIPGQAWLRLRLPVTNSAAIDPTHETAFATADALQPQPLDGHLQRFERRKDFLNLQLEGPQLARASQLDFIPDTPGLFAAQAELRSRRLPRGWQLSIAAGGSTAHPTGLLRVVRADGVVSGYTLAATPGAVATLPAPPPPKAAASGLGWAQALLLAALGGLLLNLMPCVFPVLSLKAFALIQQGHGPEAKRQSLAYTAGVLASMLTLASALLALRAGGAALGWGFQLQSPVVLVLLVYLMLGLGLAMSGLVEVGAGLSNLGGGLAAKPGIAGSFWTGVLAVAVASPCTGPYMGSTLGWAVTQPPAMGLAVFAALGLGLALPFLLLGFVPAFARWLPRPGAWMLRLKQAMAFPLYLTAAWLAWVLARQAGADALGIALVGAVLIALALWLWSLAQGVARWLALGVLIAALSLAALPTLREVPKQTPETSTSGDSRKAAWSPEREAELRKANRIVFVDFTADWCLTCKLNERGALQDARVQAHFAEKGVVTLVADWTRSDPRITEALQAFGRNGVPLYVVYAPGKAPQVLPQLLTPEILIAATP